MILLAALLCNYGRGFCLIDVGTEGPAGSDAESERYPYLLRLLILVEHAEILETFRVEPR